MSDGPYDVFLSYAHRSEAELADALEPELTGRGLRVFRDISQIDDFESIAARLADALARSRALVALYSPTYPTRRGCQWELTGAYIACEQRGIDPVERLLVVNVAPDPDDRVGHILPETLRVQSIHGPQDRSAAEIAEAIAARLEVLDATCFGEGGVGLGPPRVLPALRTGSELFVGRLPEMWQIHGALRNRAREALGGRVAPAIVHAAGMGGMGKSLLAEEYALRYHAAYPGGVLWIPLGGTEAGIEGARANADIALRQVADQLQIDTPDRTLGQVKAAVQERMLGDGPVLAVLDDLPPSAPRALIDEIAFTEPAVAQLITTRDATYGEGMIGNRILIDTLPDEEGRRLLAAHGGIGADDPIAGEIVERLGGHALALDVAGAYLALAGDPQSFLDRLDHPSDDVIELAGKLSDTLPNDHQTSVAITLRASIEHLSEEATMVLEVAAVLSTAEMPVELIRRVLARDRREGVSADAVLIGLTGPEGLRDHSLAGQSEQTKAWGVHGLVSRVMTQQLLSAERTRALHTAALDTLTELIIEHQSTPRDPLLDAALAHGHALAGSEDDERSLLLASWVGHAEEWRGNDAGARVLAERVFEGVRRILGEEHPDTLTTMNNLARTLQAQGDLAGARELHGSVLEARRRILGEEHLDTLTSMNNLATTLAVQGDLPGARGLQERVVEGLRRILGEEHPRTLASMNNLSTTLQAQGDLPGARELQERVLEARRRILGEEHPNTLTSKNNLAETLQAQGDLVGARELHELALEARRRTLGEEHPETLGSMINLAATLQDQGDLAGARAFLEDGLRTAEVALGKDHPITVIIRQLRDT
jgi:Tetratricopeptide repeat/TIR domain